MKCIKCLTENKGEADHCVNCGEPLLSINISDYYRKSTVTVFFIVLLAVVVLFSYYFHSIIINDSQTAESMSSAVKEKQDELHGLEEKLKEAKKELSAVQGGEKETTAKTAEALKRENEVVSGWVVITDRWGRQVARFRSGLSGNGWLALPARACLGGSNWHFYSDSGLEAGISGGLWINGDNVGLWHLFDDTDDLDGPGLASWDREGPVSWLSLETSSEYHSIKLGPGRPEGFFISTSLPDYINEIGMFFQGGKTVGWSFGKLLPKGYMWQGKAGPELEYRTWVSYFYNTTFANGREEKFAMALNMHKDTSGLDQLSSFIKGFQFQPKLAREETPYYLLPEEIIKKIRVLVTKKIQDGEGKEVVDILSSQALKNIGDISVLIDIVPAIASIYGFWAAIDEIENSGKYISQQTGDDFPELNKLHVYLYRAWLQSLIDDREIEEGLQTYSHAKSVYPDDSHIHLLGVELALLNGDWEEAERLLNIRDYPSAFNDRHQLLALRIDEMKGEEGKIVIRFPPGAARIALYATINESFNQNFLVDTGATTVTIPSAMADALDLEVIHGKRKVATVGGVVIVSEVLIDSIEIDGWVEYNIRAFVIDMPDQPGLGLLGTNYLGRFQMDINPEEGRLLLIPR